VDPPESFCWQLFVHCQNVLGLLSSASWQTLEQCIEYPTADPGPLTGKALWKALAQCKNKIKTSRRKNIIHTNGRAHQGWNERFEKDQLLRS
jgi:hypothetical protein